MAMEKLDWEKRLERRHQTPPPAPAGEWAAVVERGRERPARVGWAVALGSSLALAALAVVLLVPRRGPVEAVGTDDENLATEQWVQQQWHSTAAGALEDDQAAEPDAGLLALMDKV
jgi:hypothetical protein